MCGLAIALNNANNTNNPTLSASHSPPWFTSEVQRGGTLSSKQPATAPSCSPSSAPVSHKALTHSTPTVQTALTMQRTADQWLLVTPHPPVLCYSGGRDFRVGKISAPQILVPCVQLREPLSLGYAAKKIFWDTHWAHKIILWDAHDTQGKFLGICTNMKTDPDMQHTGTSPSMQKKNFSRRPTEQEMSWIAQNISGVNFGTNLKNDIFPKKISPAEIPPPSTLCSSHHWRG